MNTSADRELLAQKVASAFQSAFAKLEEHRADIERLWKEFESLSYGETIMGCKTKTEFCKKVLHRSIRAVQYLLSGGNPVSKRRRRETVSPAHSGTRVDTLMCRILEALESRKLNDSIERFCFRTHTSETTLQRYAQQRLTLSAELRKAANKLSRYADEVESEEVGASWSTLAPSTLFGRPDVTPRHESIEAY